MLLNPTYRSMIKCLMTRPYTLSELVAELELPMDKVYYRMKRLEEPGLVKVVRQQTRPGKPLKYYAMTAQQYELPFANTPNATLDELVLGQMLERQEVFRSHLMDNLAKYLREEAKNPGFIMEMRDGILLIELNVKQKMKGNSGIIYWRPLHLASKDVDDFFAELVELTEKYIAKASPDERTEHLLGIQLVRKP